MYNIVGEVHATISLEQYSYAHDIEFESRHTLYCGYFYGEKYEEKTGNAK